MRKELVRSAWAAAGALLLVLAPVVPAHALDASEVAAEAASLRPGQFVWRPALAREGEIEIVVSLPLQRLYVYRGGTLIGVSTVSTGREGNETPTGTFNILQKRREHYSNLYDNAPMPFMQRIDRFGIALHAGHNPGHPASHGCIRLTRSDALWLFARVDIGTHVHVAGGEHVFEAGADAPAAA